MSLRNKTLVSVVSALALWPTWLAAQQPTSAGSTQQLTKEVRDLTQQIGKLADQLQKVQVDIAQLKGQAGPGQTGAAAVNSTPVGASDYVPRAEFQALQNQVKANTDLIDSVDDKLVSMREDNRELLDQVFQQNNEQSKMLAAISTRGTAGTPIPNLRAIMNDTQGRQALEGAVHEVLRRQGTVIVENRMPQGYSIELNRQSHYVAPGEAKTFTDVPVGTVTTELVGYEEPKQWALTPPAYELKIVIGPQQRQVVRRVMSPVDAEYQAAIPMIYTPVEVWYGL